MEKSHVGMSTCFYCGKEKGIVLDRRLRNTLPRAACYDYKPCDECEAYMKQGIILISVNEKLSTDLKNPYRTGCWIVVREDYIRKIVEPAELMEDICKKRVAFIPDETWTALGLPTKEEQL